MKLTDQQIAWLAHEANRAFCRLMGDTSEPYWGDAPHWVRSLTTDGIAFQKTNPNATSEEMHSHWLRVMASQGWTHGAEKLPEDKKHPNMVATHQLPWEERFKGVLFKAVAQAALNFNPDGRPILEQTEAAQKVTQEDVDAEIASEDYHVFAGTSLTVCSLQMLNGFTVTGESACVDPSNFNAELGREIALGKAKEKIWGLLAFRMLDKRMAHWEQNEDQPIHKGEADA